MTPRVYYRAVLTLIGILGLALGAAASGPLRGTFWGWHVWAFVPPAVGFLAVVAVVAAWVLLLRRSEALRSDPDSESLERVNPHGEFWK